MLNKTTWAFALAVALAAAPLAGAGAAGAPNGEKPRPPERPLQMPVHQRRKIGPSRREAFFAQAGRSRDVQHYLGRNKHELER